MTEEERLLYLEQKRLAEEGMKKKKEDMLTQFLKVADLSSVNSFDCFFYSYSLSALILQDKLLKEEKKCKVHFKQATKPVEGNHDRRFDQQKN